MDNIIILQECAAANEPVIVGETQDCDMTQNEFLAAQRFLGASITQNEVLEKGRVVKFWVKVNP